MNDERIREKQSIIKRNNLIIISIIAFIFLMLKILLHQDFVTYLSEVYLLFSALVVLFIAGIYKVRQEVVDERVKQNQLFIYDKGFIFVVLSGILFYSISVLFYITNSQFTLQPNMSINLMFSLCLILSYINTRKNDLTFNYKIIELDKRDYYKEVFKNIAKGFIFMLVICLTINIFRLFNIVKHRIIIVVCINIFNSFILMAFQYFIFSIYERIHSEEKYEIYDGKYRYISRKSVFLFIIYAIYFTVAAFINLIAYYIRTITECTSNIDVYLYRLRIYFEIINLTLIYVGITYIVLILINRYIIKKSIGRALNLKRNILNVITIFIWVGFVIGLIVWAFDVLINTGLVNLLFPEKYMVFYSVYSIFGISYSLFMFLSIVLILFMFYKRKIEYRSLYLVIVIINILQYIMPRIVIALGWHIKEGIEQGIFLSNIVGFILSLIVNILMLILLVKLSKTFKKNEVNIEEKILKD